MRKAFLLVSVVCSITICKAQVIISGKLRDNKGKPIPGAIISIKDTYDGGIADSSGNASRPYLSFLQDSIMDIPKRNIHVIFLKNFILFNFFDDD